MKNTFSISFLGKKTKLILLFVLSFSFQIIAQNSYQFTVLNGSYSPVNGGTPVTSIQNYFALSSPINLGFTFTFNGLNYNEIVASSTGYLSFNTSAILSYSANLRNSDERPLVAPLLSDLPGTNGSASYITTGTFPNRVFTFEWLNWGWDYSLAQPCISFQVKLYETTNRIEYVYRQESGALDYFFATIGMALQDKGIGNFLSLSDAGTSPTISTSVENQNINTKPASGQIYRFDYVIDPEPDSYATDFGSINSISNILLSWTDAAGIQAPDGYLILASTTNSFVNPADGIDIVQDYDLSDGVAKVKVPHGIGKFSNWINFKELTNYYFRIYSYSNNGIYINYRIADPIPAYQFVSQISLLNKYSFPIVNTYGSNLTAWGDYDNDGYLDNIFGNQLYKNNGNNTYTYLQDIEEFNMYTISGGLAVWADFNNNVDLDFIFSYWSQKEFGAANYTNIYKNNNSIFTSYIPFNNFVSSSIVWSDLNNDGHLDCIIAGYKKSSLNYIYQEATTRIYLYENDSNYLESDINLKGGQNLAIGDYNNDNYQDILVLGTDINTIRHMTLYKNNGDNTFIEQKNTFFPPISEGFAIWGDYNNDGFLDVLIGGKDNSGHAISKIFKNNGNDSFSEQTSIFLEGLSGSNGLWGDYDNDGNLDIIIGGKNTNNISSCKIYRNNNDNTFTEKTSFPLSSFLPNSLTWIDTDNDGNLDLTLMGNVWKNYNPVKNTKPQFPQNLKNNRISASSIKLSWDAASDNETPFSGLSYNIRIGTQPGKSDVVSPMSATDGLRRIVGMGNANLGNEFIINNLTPGQTYYWSVQTIDNGFMASEFSEEQSFKIVPDFASVFYTAQDVYNPLAAWGDFNNDSYLDIAYGDFILKNNTTGNFDFYHHFPSDKTKPIAWGDYNNDGVLEFISGNTVYKMVYGIYEPQTEISLKSLLEGSSAWGDYDNDGYLDLIMTGKMDINSDPVSILYRNNGSSNSGFTEQVDITLKGGLAAAWGDYDNDADLDILIGNILYKNNGNNSFSQQTDILLTGGSSISWGDYESDGDLDILLTGFDSVADPVTNIYRNEGNGKFIKIESDIRKTRGHAHWGDWNNDGFMDILLSGESGSNISRVYTNKEHDTFYESFRFDGLISGTQIGWADYNKDGNLDFFESGYSLQGHGDLPFIQIFKNNTGIQNFLPGIVSNLKNEIQGFNIKLNWDKATDPNCPGGSLYYNIRVGTAPGGYEILAPMADSITGNRRVPALGNAQCNTFGILKNLKPGTYYWSVQGIDQSYTGGPWAAEQTFTIPNISAGFDADTVCFGTATSFKDLSLGVGINSWNWDFGDGNTSTEQNPVHTYLIAGNYQVNLTIHSASYEHSIIKNVEVKFGPNADFSIIRKPGLVCQFTNLTDVNAQNVTQWQWNFGDDSTATSKFLPLYEYKKDGQYQVSLKVQTENGCVDSVSKPNLVCSSGIEIPELYVRGPNVWYFAASNDSVSNYRWYRNDVLVQDSNQYIYVANQEVGTYYVEINNGGACWVSSSKITIPDDFFSGKAKKMAKISELQGNQNSSMLFPNPSHGKFTILLDNEYTGKLLINIKDLSGKTLRQYYADKNESFYLEDMDLSKYGKGIYFIELINGIEKQVQKVIIE